MPKIINSIMEEIKCTIWINYHYNYFFLFFIFHIAIPPSFSLFFYPLIFQCTDKYITVCVCVYRAVCVQKVFYVLCEYVMFMFFRYGRRVFTCTQFFPDNIITLSHNSYLHNTYTYTHTHTHTHSRTHSRTKCNIRLHGGEHHRTDPFLCFFIFSLVF